MNGGVIFQKFRSLEVGDLETVAVKYVREAVFKVLFSSAGVAPIAGPALKSGKKYDIYLSDDLESSPDAQAEEFAHELIHIWLFEECGLPHNDEYEEQIILTSRALAKNQGDKLVFLLGKYLVK